MQREVVSSPEQSQTARRPGFIDGPDLLSECGPRIAKFYGLWDSKRAGRLMPSRGDFDIFELKPWLGWITLLDVLPDALPDGHDFRYRLVGTNLNRFRDRDPTGQRMSESTLALNPQVMLNNARDICSSRAPRYRYDAVPMANSRFYTPPRIYLPLGDGGETVNVIMILAIDPLDAQGKPATAPRTGQF